MITITCRILWMPVRLAARVPPPAVGAANAASTSAAQAQARAGPDSSTATGRGLPTTATADQGAKATRAGVSRRRSRGSMSGRAQSWKGVEDGGQDATGEG